MLIRVLLIIIWLNTALCAKLLQGSTNIPNHDIKCPAAPKFINRHIEPDPTNFRLG
eukprot:CAMPEP_0172313684 /NCGR_PEP_ID=MMETSP1058-20130122/20767_1 /TAXON_ID=83371 /ORGANISM="Detonula confervacea, Strain CCMP 353" /LENGTH=55 /DNA_ID=CAMNT_0013027383 /DNA_START=213 /DNA_END=376 /DNA_ORIENTATION=+